MTDPEMHLVYGEKYIYETRRRMTRLLVGINSSYSCMRESVFAAFSRSFEHISSLDECEQVCSEPTLNDKGDSLKCTHLAFEEIRIENKLL